MKPYQQYIVAILQNPEFLKYVSLRYGGGMVGEDKGHPCPIVNFNSDQLARAIHNLDVAMAALFDVDDDAKENKS